MAHRFKNVDIATVTLDNVNEVLPESLFLQLEFFLPPEGSFDDGCLQRYLTILKQYEEEDENSHMTLANRLRLAFQEPTPATICGKFPQAELPLKRLKRGAIPEADIFLNWIEVGCFDAICKNYLMGQIIKDQKETNRKISYEDISSSLEERPDLTYEIDIDVVETDLLINTYLSDLRNFIANENLSESEKG